MTFVSYAQNFEDVMLWRALKHVDNGFYVDVGAQDPVVDSVSLAFYERGWRGVHVEPVPEYAQLLRQARSDELVIEKAVGEEAGEMTLHVIPSTGLSSLIEENARAAVALRGYERFEIRVPVVTLDELLVPYAGRDIHWLKVDVEGSERDVLRGWNWKRDRPWIMVVEATVPNSPKECYEEWEPIFLAADYQFVYFDGLSRFYVAREHWDLAESFHKPPNVFDEFQRANLVTALAERDDYARQLNEVRYQLSETAAQLEARETELARTQQQLATRDAELAQTQQQLATRDAELAQTQQQLATRDAELGRVREQLSEAEHRTAALLRALRGELPRPCAESLSRPGALEAQCWEWGSAAGMSQRLTRLA